MEKTFSLFDKKLTPQLFNKISQLVFDSCGIKMSEQKKSMLEARLRKRLRALNLDSYHDYYELLRQPEGRRAELHNFIDVVTTNKTDFFREPAHFDYLVNEALPNIYREGRPERPLKIWSAGCSRGKEPYTLAMVLNESKQRFPQLNFSILATDISTQALQDAQLGIYKEDRIEPVPRSYRKKYFLRSKDRERKEVRVTPAIRKQVEFKRLNFMDEEYQVARDLDVIFCRNVIIYFNLETQRLFLSRLIKHLRPGGYLFMGHSETLNGLGLPVRHLAPSVYQKN